MVIKEEGYEEIRGEIEMLQQCNHPNVVRYLGSYQGEEYLWVRIHFITLACYSYSTAFVKIFVYLEYSCDFGLMVTFFFGLLWGYGGDWLIFTLDKCL